MNTSAQITELLSNRQAQMTNMFNDGKNNVRMEYRIPTKGLIGFRSAFLTATKGEGVMNSTFMGFEPWAGEISNTRSGSVLVASETGRGGDLWTEQCSGTRLDYILKPAPRSMKA